MPFNGPFPEGALPCDAYPRRAQNGEDLFEIDTLAAAVLILVGWSRGEDVSHPTGPIQPHELL